MRVDHKPSMFAVGGLIGAATGLLVTATAHRLRSARRRIDLPVSALVADCERTAAEAMELVWAPDAPEDGGVEGRSASLRARLVELELGITRAANRPCDARVRRALDGLAAGVVALRGALEVDVRLRCDPAADERIRTAGRNIAGVRCDDLLTTAHALDRAVRADG